MIKSPGRGGIKATQIIRSADHIRVTSSPEVSRWLENSIPNHDTISHRAVQASGERIDMFKSCPANVFA